jgi:lysine/ornithine N-monooxygenase
MPPILLVRKEFTVGNSTLCKRKRRLSFLTDTSSGAKLVERTFVYLSSVTKECRKAVSENFEQAHKGIPFDSVDKVMRQEIESWFSKRDKNIRLSHDRSLRGRPGEILVTYSGATKDAHFKIHVDGVFTLAGSSNNAPSYLKSLDLHVDKRDFTR